MSSDFNLITELQNNTLVMKTEGYINNTAGERMVQEFTNKFNASANKVIIDLEKSKMINSIGISYLLEIIETLNEKEGKLVFVNLDPTIEKTFKIMGLFQFAGKADSLNSALE
jgi:anti-sigma B factor antagonist